ncbi:Carboxy-terminal domain (CTD) phosphatase [Irineochytrium annulatum]|nr:Carboxy-terminal domain (CTD) phosphatase [Irineochytrium annulatum]
MNKLYEMHIYTMGTRNYAVAVAEILDPDGSLFKGRILSRDDSGNDFFVGIGDINDPKSLKANGGAAEPVPLPKAEAGTEGEPVGNTAAVTQDQLVEEHLYAKPLADLQKKEDEEDDKLERLEEGLEHSAEGSRIDNHVPIHDGVGARTAMLPVDIPTADGSGNNMSLNVGDEGLASAGPVPPVAPKSSNRPVRRRPVLHDHDMELHYITLVLEEVHARFFASLAGESFGYGDHVEEADVRILMPHMKRRVLDGCSLVFSGVIPIGCDPMRHDVWNVAKAYGAECSVDLEDTTTHLVAAKKGTQKVNRAKRKKGWIVKPEWFFHSVGRWKRMDEADYVLEVAEDTQNNSAIASPPEALNDMGSEDIFAKIGAEDFSDVLRELDDEDFESSEEDEGVTKEVKMAELDGAMDFGDGDDLDALLDQELIELEESNSKR